MRPSRRAASRWTAAFHNNQLVSPTIGRLTTTRFPSGRKQAQASGKSILVDCQGPRRRSLGKFLVHAVLKSFVPVVHGVGWTSVAVFTLTVLMRGRPQGAAQVGLILIQAATLTSDVARLEINQNRNSFRLQRRPVEMTSLCTAQSKGARNIRDAGALRHAARDLFTERREQCFG